MEGVADGTASGYEDSQTTEKKTKINQLNTIHFTENIIVPVFGSHTFTMTLSKATEA